MKSQEKLTQVDSKRKAVASLEDSITTQWLKTRIECEAASKICRGWKKDEIKIMKEKVRHAIIISTSHITNKLDKCVTRKSLQIFLYNNIFMTHCQKCPRFGMNLVLLCIPKIIYNKIRSYTYFEFCYWNLNFPIMRTKSSHKLILLNFS